MRAIRLSLGLIATSYKPSPAHVPRGNPGTLCHSPRSGYQCLPLGGAPVQTATSAILLGLLAWGETSLAVDAPTRATQESLPRRRVAGPGPRAVTFPDHQFTLPR